MMKQILAWLRLKILSGPERVYLFLYLMFFPDEVKPQADSIMEAMADRVRRLAREIGVDARPIIFPAPSSGLGVGGVTCPKCQEQTPVIVEPEGLCPICWGENLRERIRLY